jgi:pimeloyl-ACP methyl ester carboxylesterase
VKPVYLPTEGAFLRYVEIPGDDPPLVWLHGWMCSSTGELLSTAVQPPLLGRRSLLVDFLGHGYSDKPPDFGYAIEDHARTIVTLLDALGLADCGLIGHSMGGAVATHVAAARPDIVSLLVLAEGAVGLAGGDPTFAGQTEGEFVERGFAALLAGQVADAAAQPTGLMATHLGMTRLVAPHALYREAMSLDRGTDPSVRAVLGALEMPRWYFMGQMSDPGVNEVRWLDGWRADEPPRTLEDDLAALGVGWRIVPDAGHPMGLQNPAGFALAVAKAAATSAWPT